MKGKAIPVLEALPLFGACALKKGLVLERTTIWARAANKHLTNVA